MNTKNKLVLVAVFFGLATVYVLIQVIAQYNFVAGYKNQYSVSTKGRVEFVGREVGSGTWSFPKYGVKYYDRNNHSYTVENPTRMDVTYQIGDSLDVRYRPENPQESIIDNYSQLEGYLKRGMLAFSLLLFVFISIRLVAM